jgi:uridine phosphorylase
VPNPADDPPSPLFEPKATDEASVFTPESLLDGARRQKGLPERSVPDVCVLDPDGDLVRRLAASGAAHKADHWPGYHTDLYRLERDGVAYGLVGRAVGAPFATLVAEQLFAAGCQLLVSVTSAGQLTAMDDPPYFVVIDRALRDEGTSHHYAPPERDARLDDALATAVLEACAGIPQPVYRGTSWTTDAPFRETEAAIERARAAGAVCVEMEAAALYTLAAVRDVPIVCVAHVTNQLGQADDEFEKGEADGSHDALAVVEAAASAWRSLD